MQERYGKTNFGRGCLMARRLVEVGVPFVEVDLGGWDTHANNFTTLCRTEAARAGQGDERPGRRSGRARAVDDTLSSGWASSAARRGSTATPAATTGPAAGAWWWAAPASSGGMVVGKTNADGTEVESEPYTSQDLMASVCKALGISLDTTFTRRNGRPMKIANSGKVIKELFA